MKTSKTVSEITEKTIVKFHIGRGGRFYNGGFKTYKGKERIDHGHEFDSLFLHEGEDEYSDGSGNSVDLTVKEADTGIGTINQDHDYDTTYTVYLQDCGEEELLAIFEADPYDKNELIASATGQNIRTIKLLAENGELKAAIRNNEYDLEFYEIGEE